jgi:hypothetical protein
MLSWKEILADVTAFPDDVVITTKDGQTLKLGEARAYDKETKGALTEQLTAKEKALAKEKQQLETASNGVYEMFNKYLTLTGLTAEEALAGKAPKITKRQVAEDTGLDPDDPLLAPMVKEFNALKAKVGTLEGQLSEAKEKILKPMLGTYLDDWYGDQWSDKIEPKLPAKAKDKIKLEDVMKHAEKEGLKDSKGRLNLRKAAEDMTSEYRQDEWREAERIKLKKELEDEQFASSLPKPGSNSPGPRGATPKSFKDDKGRTKSFDQVLQDAANDTELWSGIMAGRASN